jgi:integrase
MTKKPMKPPSATAARVNPAIPLSPRAASAKTLAESYAAASQASATVRAYASDLLHFRKNGGRIPATADQLAEYLAAFAGKLAVATLGRRLAAIHRAHVDDGYESPALSSLVRKTMSGIRRTFGVRQNQAKPMCRDDLLEVLVLVDQQNPVKAARDRALLLIGFAGAFRRSELVALRVEDMVEHDAGLELMLRKSKTDQEQEGRTVFIPHAHGERCPVKALKDWLKIASITEGPLFRAVSRSDYVYAKAMAAQSVALVVKAAVRRVGGDATRFSGHSLRSGYCTQAAIAGLQPYQIREQTGHKSDATLAKYIRPVAKRKIPSLL